jgi:hypothetical protein
MSYRRTGWKSETENTSKSTTLENQTSTSSFDYSIIPSTIFNIGLIIVACLFFTTCRVDDKVIKQCQESCKTRMSNARMERVTFYSCNCTAESTSVLSVPSDPWILPRN